MIETNSKTKSQFVGYFGVKNVETIERDLILPTVQKFFAARNIQTFKPIDESAAISDLDFDRKTLLIFSRIFMNSLSMAFIKTAITLKFP